MCLSHCHTHSHCHACTKRSCSRLYSYCMWGCQNASGTLSTTPPFSMILTNAVSFPSALAGKWKVKYGVGITPPASYYKGWDNDGGNAAKWLSSPTPEQLKNVNCIRYTSIDTLEDGHIADLICSVAVDESDSDKRQSCFSLAQTLTISAGRPSFPSTKSPIMPPLLFALNSLAPLRFAWQYKFQLHRLT